MVIYKTVKVREDVCDELHKLVNAMAPPPPGRPPQISDVLMLAIEALRKEKRIRAE